MTSDIKILEEKDNPLFNRKEIKIIVTSESSPTRVDTEKLLSEKFSSQIESIAIKSIKGKFGRNTFLITASIYKSPEDKVKTEPKPKTKKNK